MAYQYPAQPAPQQPPANPAAYGYYPPDQQQPVPPPQGQPQAQPQTQPGYPPQQPAQTNGFQPQPQQTPPSSPPQPQGGGGGGGAVFDLDDLLDVGNTGTAQQKSAIPPPPSYPPPPPVNDDPFGFQNQPAAAQPQPQVPPPAPVQQQPQAPVAAPQQPAYQYQPPAQPAQAQQPQPPPQAQPLPQQQGAPAAPYTYQAPPGEQPPYQQPTQPAPPQPAQYPPPEGQPQQYGQAPLPQQQQQQPGWGAPQGAVLPPAGAGYPPAPGAGAGYPPQQQGQPPASASAMPPPATAEEEADRERLEQLQRLRRELELEQGREKEKVEERETWACPTCTYRNKLDLTECTMCDTPRPGFSSTQGKPSASPPQTAPVAARPSGPSTSPGGSSQWLCPRCAVANSDAANLCKVCNTPKPTEATSAHPEVRTAAPPATAPNPPAKANEWSCPVCTLANPLTTPACNACSNPRPPHLHVPAVQAVPVGAPPAGGAGAGPAGGAAGVWHCPQCTFENPKANPKCSMCDTPQPGYVPPPHPAVAGGAQMYPAGRVVRQGAPTRQQPAQPTRQQAVTPPAQPGDEVRWQEDKFATSCNKCNAAFGVLTRKHHCRSCGFVFCSNCSSNKAKLKPTDKDEVRMCIDCFREKTMQQYTGGAVSAPPAPGRAPAALAPAPAPAPVRAPAPAPVGNCDCAMGAEGFHRPECPLRR